MKKLIRYLLIFLIMLLSIAPPSYFAVAAEITDNAVIVMSGEIDGEEITVNAKLQENTGIYGLTVEIAYDTSVMTLTNVTQGWALGGLEYTTTNVETEAGYAYTPFKINWLGKNDENDDSTGRLISMTFQLKENVKNGEYEITLKGDGANERIIATYLNEGTDVGTKNVLVDRVKVKIKGNKPEAVVTETAEAAVNTELLIAICASSVLVIAIVIFLLIKIKGKKS